MSNPVSYAAFTIPDTKTDGPATFPFFILLIRSLTICLLTEVGHQRVHSMKAWHCSLHIKNTQENAKAEKAYTHDFNYDHTPYKDSESGGNQRNVLWRD